MIEVILFFLESLLTVSSTSYFTNHFLKLEDILNKMRLFNTVSFIKKSIILSIHFLRFIFKRRKRKRKEKVFFFFINFLILSNFFQNITLFKYNKHSGKIIFSKYYIIFMGNLQNSLRLTYLNQLKPNNLINKYSKEEGEGILQL